MQIHLSPKKRRRQLWLLSVGSAALLLSLMSLMWLPSQPSARASQLGFSEVKRGPFTATLNVFGQLHATDERLLTAQVAGRVVQVFAKPGMRLEANQVLFELENPLLRQEHQQAQAKLAEQQAAFQAFLHRQQQQKIEQLQQQQDIQAAIDEAALDVEVHQELNQRGVSAKIELRKAQLQLSQQNQRLVAAKEVYAQLLKMQTFERQAQQVMLDQLQANADALAQQVAGLRFSLAEATNLLALDLTLGQEVQAGENLGTVGNLAQMRALLKIPQRDAETVKPGMAAEILLNQQRLATEIARIETQVADGFVLAEVILPGPLPAAARPARQVQAEITLAHWPDVLLAQVPSSVQAQSSQRLFVQRGDALIAARVQLGPRNQQQVLIEGGLQAGDQLAFHLPEALLQQPSIRLIYD